MAVVFQLDKEWDYISMNPRTGKPNPSHESDIDGADVLRLANQGCSILTMQLRKTVADARMPMPSYSVPTEPAAAPVLQPLDTALLALYDKLKSTGTHIVTVLKGVHQRHSNPHVTAVVKPLKPFHIWLSLTEAPGGKLVWMAKSITAQERGAMIPKCEIVGVRRRGSITYSAFLAEGAAKATEGGSQ